MKALLRIFTILLFTATLLGPYQGSVLAQASECVPGTVECDQSGSQGSVSAEATAGLKSAYTTAIKGGYVAHGVAMRNQGSGTIYIQDVPAGATVVKAYLFWSVIGPSYLPGYYYYKGYFNNQAISGSLVQSGANPCWGSVPVWTYRADVTTRIKKGGNGSYSLSGFPSGLTDGSDPWKSSTVYPLLDGASLVLVFSKSTYPLTTIKIYNGASTTTGSELHQIVPSMNAVGLTGASQATYIVADGQYESELSPHFFTTPLRLTFNGADPNGNGAPFSDGNLWDTQTVDLHSLLQPPETDFWFTLGGGQDCLTWVAQVVSYSSGNQDADGDKIKDGYELNGYRDSSGNVLVDFPAYGADPLHKDLFIEADYMGTGTTDDHLIDVAHLDDIVSVFNNAPVSNPDGTTGIHIHIDTGGAASGAAPGTYPQYDLGGGNSVPHVVDLGTADASCNSYNWDDFQAIKDSNFSSYRTGFFHYMIFAHDLAPCFGSVSGISRNGSSDSAFIKGAADFIVSMGSWTSMGTQGQREGTFIHELGHNLGLRHGGNDHANYKPNYLSVMNYFFQTTGVYRGGSYVYDYSRILAPSLAETTLNEVKGLGALAASYGTTWYCPNGTKNSTTNAGSNVDWNCDGDGGTDTSVKVNVNHDFSNSSPYPPLYTTLGDQNNWASITFAGGGVMGSGASSGLALHPLAVTTRVKELSFDELLKFSPDGQ